MSKWSTAICYIVLDCGVLIDTGVGYRAIKHDGDNKFFPRLLWLL